MIGKRTWDGTGLVTGMIKGLAPVLMTGLARGLVRGLSTVLVTGQD
jgi:hypothetical protein